MSSPRIISGKAGGLRLKPVPGNVTRPITDKVKQALFNIIGGDIEGSVLLDLFGGTGSVGLEAISRGANFVVFVEKHHSAVKTIRENITLTHFEEFSEIIHTDAFTYLHRVPARKFDFIFIAPPQYKGMWKKALAEIDESCGWLSSGCIVIAQIDILEYEKSEYAHLEEYSQKRYGDTLLVFYEVMGC